MNQVAVVDGANVALQEKNESGKAKTSNIVNMRDLLESRGYRTIIITDARLRYEVDDMSRFDKLENEGIIYQAPADTPADYFILRTAEQEEAIVISNDRYQEYQDKYPWIEDRRIPFMIVDGHIMLYCPEEKEAGDD